MDQRATGEDPTVHEYVRANDHYLLERRWHAHFPNDVYSFKYHVVRRRGDCVVIRDDAPMDMGRDIRIRFVNGDTGYWIDAGPLRIRFGGEI